MAANRALTSIGGPAIGDGGASVGASYVIYDSDNNLVETAAGPNIGGVNVVISYEDMGRVDDIIKDAVVANESDPTLEVFLIKG